MRKNAMLHVDDVKDNPQCRAFVPNVGALMWYNNATKYPEEQKLLLAERGVLYRSWRAAQFAAFKSCSRHWKGGC